MISDIENRLKKELGDRLYDEYRQRIAGRSPTDFCDACIALQRKRNKGKFFPTCTRSANLTVEEKFGHLDARSKLIASMTLDATVWAKEMFGWEARWYQHQSLRCIKWDQKVFMADGTVKNIADVKVGDCVLSYNEIRREFPKTYKVSAKYCNGIQKVYRLTLDNGDILEVTSNHPILAHHRNGKVNTMYGCPSLLTGYKSIDEGLDVGDNLYTINNFSVFGKVDDPDLAIILGYISTDGYIGSKNHGKGALVQFVNTEKGYNIELEACIKRRFPDVKIRRKVKLPYVDKNGVKHKKSWWTELKGRGNSLRRFLNQIGAHDKTDREEAIANYAFSFTKEPLRLFINRSWSGDGCAYSGKEKVRPQSPSLRISSGNKQYLYLIHLLLKKIGIWRSKIYKEQKEAKAKGLALAISRSIDID